MLGLIYTGTTGHWQEVWRGYGRSTAEEKLAERTDIGLGTASVEHIAESAAASEDKVLKVKTGTNLEADDVLAVNTSGQIVAATITTNATTLNGEPSTEYVRKTGTAAQSIDADLTVATTNASLIADGTSTAALRLKGGDAGSGVERAFIEMTTSDGELVIGTRAAGGGLQGGIKIDAASSKLEYSSEMGIAAWKEVAFINGLGVAQYFSPDAFSTSTSSQSYSIAPIDGSGTEIAYTIATTGVSIDLSYHCNGYHHFDYDSGSRLDNAAIWQYQVEDEFGAVLTAWRSNRPGGDGSDYYWIIDDYNLISTDTHSSGDASHNHRIHRVMVTDVPPLILAIDGTGDLVAGNILKFRMRMRSDEVFFDNSYTAIAWSVSTLRVMPGLGV
jgi:hypothetical protein